MITDIILGPGTAPNSIFVIQHKDCDRPLLSIAPDGKISIVDKDGQTIIVDGDSRIMEVINVQWKQFADKLEDRGHRG